MEADRLKWNERYLTKPDNNPPDTYLQKNMHNLRKSRLLDIAGGNGRNAIYLSLHGFDVTLVDIAEVGFQRLANNIRYRNFNIRTIQIDLDEPNALKSENKFDSIVCINFKPQLKLLHLFGQLLHPSGTFLLCSFNELQAVETGFPLDKSLKLNEFTDYFPDFVLLDYKRFEDETGKRDGYLFRRNEWNLPKH